MNRPTVRRSTSAPAETVGPGGPPSPGPEPRVGSGVPSRVDRPGGRWLVPASLAVAALTLLGPSAPTYDPWSWINWGREVALLDLDTVAGPSWKPLPVVLTTVFSLAGDAAPDLWMLVARAGGLLALVMAYRLGTRLAGRTAGAVAAVALLLADGWFYTVGLGNSEGILVALGLWSAERHLDGRPDHAFTLGVGVALLRPEAWPFVGLYGVWLLWARPSARVLVAAGFLAIPLLWFLPEVWGSGELLRSSDRANTPDALSPAFADRPALAVLARWVAVVPVPALVGLALALALAPFAARRVEGRVALALGVVGAAWLGLVALMTQAGFSGNFRYILLPVALACVLGGVGWGWLLRSVAAAATRLGGRRAVGVRVVLGALALLATVPFVPRLVEAAPREMAKLAYEAELYDSLAVAVTRAGGPGRVLARGRPVTGPYQVPGLAWRLRTHGIVVGLDPREAGTVFRAPPVMGARPEPPLPSRNPRLRTTARAGPWEVSVACRPRPAAGRATAVRSPAPSP